MRKISLFRKNNLKTLGNFIWSLIQFFVDVCPYYPFFKEKNIKKIQVSDKLSEKVCPKKGNKKSPIFQYFLG